MVSVNEYIESLYLRMNEGVFLRGVKVDSSDWIPVPNDCHNNVTKFCDLNTECEPVRGWVIFDYPDYVNFLAHSSVRIPSGDLVEITPSQKFGEYPFLAANLSYANFVEIERMTENGNLRFNKC